MARLTIPYKVEYQPKEPWRHDPIVLRVPDG